MMMLKKVHQSWLEAVDCSLLINNPRSRVQVGSENLGHLTWKLGLVELMHNLLHKWDLESPEDTDLEAELTNQVARKKSLELLLYRKKSPKLKRTKSAFQFRNIMSCSSIALEGYERRMCF